MTHKPRNAALHPDDEFYTEKELGRRWKLDPRTLRNWRCQGRGPSWLRIGVNIRYAKNEILRIERESVKVVL
jgi:hypothetical protein|tara:strand:+ start:51 stop:266 length:216 start_codon:yes stop_codon:yes gene_type:complete